MEVAVTGATGFLGRYVVRELTAAGHHCRGLTRFNSPDRAIEWVVGSLGDEAAVGSLVDGADAVVHAALDHPGGGFMMPEIDVAAFAKQNLIGTIRLIEAARRAKVARFIVISSGAVHDEILDDRPLDETHPLWPRSHYGATKAAIEAFVSSYGRGEGFSFAALRPTSIYGIAEPIAQSRWYDLVAAIVRGEPVHCQKGSKQVHAVDVARAVALLLTTTRPIEGQVYHCTDQYVTDHRVAHLARTVARSTSVITGTEPPARHPIACQKLRDLGLVFGGETLWRKTITAMVRLIP